MKAEIITIGDEILIGDIVNSNSSQIAEELNKIGIEIDRITTIGDNVENIVQTLKDAEKRNNIILITGGLGPTSDDVTKQALCEFFNTSLVFNENVYKRIETLLKLKGQKINELNKKQAEIPDGCEPIINQYGSAPGLWFNKGGKIFIAMPGVPHEMQAMLKNEIIPKLKKKFKLSPIAHKTVLTNGIPESSLAELLTDWENNLPNNIKLAYLPSPGVVKLRLTAKKKSLIQINKEIKKLNKIIPEYIFGYDNDTLEQIIGKLLTERKQTLSTAESCTGGFIAHLITSVSGSSKYFKGSVIAYSNEIKEKILFVDSNKIKKYGAVSKEVVEEMAKNVKEKFNTDFSIATSGIAGPTGGTADKPVGTTWIAIASPKEIISQKFSFGNNRMVNIKRTAYTALNILRKAILQIGDCK